MRLAVWLSLVVTATATSAHVLAQSVDEELRVYAVNVVKTPPLEKQFTGYGIYLGNGKVITAAHVVGHWPAVTRPRVLIGGQDLPAQVLKIGSLETVDLALLSIDQSQLPASLQLRRNPLCKTFPPVRARMVVVYPESDCGHPNLFSAIYCASIPRQPQFPDQGRAEFGIGRFYR